MPVWIKEKLFQKNLLFNNLKTHDQSYKSDENIYFSDHHLSHAASAFFPSPFDEAVILTADGVGEWATTTVAVGKNENLEKLGEFKDIHRVSRGIFSKFSKNECTTLACLKILEVGFSTDLIFSAK